MVPRSAPTAALAIEHLEGSSPIAFKLTRRSDGKSLSPVTALPFAQQRHFERRINPIPDPPPLGKLPANRINILLVVARPRKGDDDGDVGYRSISRPLVELIQTQNLRAQVTLLRPPTLDNLSATCARIRNISCSPLRWSWRVRRRER